MRHNNKVRKLGRNASHRKATLRSLATSLFKYKRIKTTVAKAKAARPYVEGLITKAKSESLHSRRHVARFVMEPEVVQALFTEIVPKVAERNGGYTRIIKLGRRFGDAAEMAILELVDFNEVSNEVAAENKDKRAEKKAAKKQTEEEKAEAAEAQA